MIILGILLFVYEEGICWVPIMDKMLHSNIKNEKIY